MNLIETLSAEDRELMLQGVRQQRFDKDEIILGQDDNTDDVFVVFDGLATATVFGSDGSIVGYRDIGPGEIFGEFAAIDGQPRSASVVAAGPCTVGTLSSDRFRHVVRENPGISWAVIEHLTAQARSMTRRIFEFSTMLVRERLIRELLRMSEKASETGEGHAIAPAPSQFMLASRISTHREAVSREMSRLNKLGILTKSRDALIIRDKEALERLLTEFEEV